MSRSWIKAPRHLVIDTIPLMLLLVSAYDRSYLLKFKRLKSYGYKEEDFEVLRKFLLSTKSITVTPGVLAEAANFLENDPNNCGPPARRAKLMPSISILSGCFEGPKAGQAAVPLVSKADSSRRARMLRPEHGLPKIAIRPLPHRQPFPLRLLRPGQRLG